MKRVQNPAIAAWRSQCPVARYRRENQLSQADLAAIIGCSVVTIQLWERGANYPGDAFRPVLSELLGSAVWREWQAWYRNRPAPQAAMALQQYARRNRRKN